MIRSKQKIGYNLIRSKQKIGYNLIRSKQKIDNTMWERKINKNYFTVIDNLISDLIDKKIINKIYSDNFGGDIKKISYFVIIQKPSWQKINEKKRIVIISINNKPRICLKFYLSKYKTMKFEFDSLKKIYKIYDGVGIVRPLDNFSFNGIDFLAEEVTHISNLIEFIVSCNSDDSVYKFLRRFYNYYSFLNSKSQPSSYENFNEELHGIVTKFQKKYLPSNEEMEIVNKSCKIILEDTKNKPILKKYRHMDLSYSNILTDGKSFVMTDIEKIDQTHLFFLDLNYLIISLYPIKEYIHNSLKQIEDTDEIKKLFSIHSSYLIKEKKLSAQFLIYLIDKYNNKINTLSEKIEREKVNKFLKTMSHTYNS